MFHVLLTLLIYGVDSESARCPETCTCVETLVTYDLSNNDTTLNFDGKNANVTNAGESLDAYKSILNSVGMNEAEYKSDLVSDNKNISRKYLQTKKCAKSFKEKNVRDIFLHNFSTKSSKKGGVNSSKEIRLKRTLKLNVNYTVNTKVQGSKINEAETDSNKNKNKIDETKKESGNGKSKEIFTYQITCSRVRDLKPLWLQRLPNSTTKLNIRETYFQSFKTFQQILRESPTKHNQLSVLSISNSVINQKADKKYSSKSEASDIERKEYEENNENKHSEFLPFASLQNAQLRSKSDFEFTSREKCKNLQVLNLVNNTITYLPKDTFHPFENIQILNLSSNLLKFIHNEMFNSLFNLLQLDIHDNRLQSLNEIMFKNLTKLIFLDVSQNMISNIAPSTFQYLISLNILNLASNPLSEKQEAVILLGTGKRLQIVDISKTGLKQIPGTLERSVRVLNLMGNHLLSIRCGDLDSYSLLSYLNLRGNKISYIEDDALGRLEFLSNLQINENNLFQIPKSLPNNLEILNLSYNNIQNITNSDFLNLSLLKELYISYNQVSSIEGNALNNLVHLKVLDLSRNPILILPNIYGLVKLTVLNLSYFTNIPRSFSSKYKQFPVQSSESLKRLILESSPMLTKVFLQDTKTLQNFVNLEELDLRFTNLTTIRKDIFSLLPKLKILKVEGNPWHCGKDILILADWLKIHQNEEKADDENEINTAHCSTPSHLHETTLIKLNLSDFQDLEKRRDSWQANSDKMFYEETGSPNSFNKSVSSGELVSDKRYANVSKTLGKKTVPEETVTVKKVFSKKYNGSSVNVLPLNVNTTKSLGGQNCCGKFVNKMDKQPVESSSSEEYSLPNSRNFSEKSLNINPITNSSKANSVTNWNDNSTDFGVEIKNSADLKPAQVSFQTVKKAEAVTAKDRLSFKNEYNFHLSYPILSSIGLVIMATLAFTSVYFSRTRRDQSYQRQNQDIEVCSISSLGNELW